MLKKSLLIMVLLLNVFVAVKAKTGIIKPQPATFYDCSFTQTNWNLQLTYGPTSFSTTQVNFAVRYVTNPYTQSQWEAGVVIGTINCFPATYVYGRRTQYDGRVMETGVTTSGNVVLKWISGPSMPTSTGSFIYYVVEMPSLNISSTGG